MLTIKCYPSEKKSYMENIRASVKSSMSGEGGGKVGDLRMYRENRYCTIQRLSSILVMVQ